MAKNRSLLAESLLGGLISGSGFLKRSDTLDDSELTLAKQINDAMESINGGNSGSQRLNVGQRDIIQASIHRWQSLAGIK